MTYLGIDIGGTSVKLGVIDDRGAVLDRAAVPTASDRDSLIEAIVAAARPLVDVHRPQAVGIGSAGRLDSTRRILLRAGNLPFCNEPLCDTIGGALSLPAYLDNDANCALLAEAKAGACAAHRDALMMTIGTGIGGAILIDGKLYRAHNNRAGEFGHFVYDREGPRCVCGLHGCFEHYASATALAKAARDKALAHPRSLLASMKTLNGKTVFAAAAEGCPAANKVLDRYAATLADGINSMVKLFMPTCIVLAGGITAAGDALLTRLRPHLLPEAALCISALGGDAGWIGAALLATEN